MGADPTNWWERGPVQALLALFIAVPLIWPTIPPLTDLPGHIGRFAVQLDLATSPELQRFYGFEWRLIGNLGLDLLVELFAPIFGLELAVKLIVLALPALGAAGLLLVARELHGRVPPLALFALPLVLGHPFTFGFVNFSFSMALALLAFALWLWLGRLGRVELRAVLFVPIGLLVWVAHSFGWAVLGMMVFLSSLVAARDAGCSWVQSLWKAGIAGLPLAPPFALMFLWQSGGIAGGTGDWLNIPSKLQWLMMAFRDRWQSFDVASVLVLLGLTIWALRSPKLRWDRRAAAIALGLLIVFIVTPRILLGSNFADMRLAPWLLALTLIAVAAPQDRKLARGLALAGLAFIGVRVAATTASFAQYHQRHSAALGAVTHLPKGTRVAAMVGVPCMPGWATERLEHIPALAIVRRHAFSNDQWALGGAQLLTIRKADAPGFVEDPAQFVTDDHCDRPDRRSLNRALETLPRAAFDYVWIISPPPFDHTRLRGLRPVWSNGTDTLYRIES